MKTVHAIWIAERVIDGEVVPAHAEAWEYTANGRYGYFVGELDLGWTEADCKELIYPA